MLYVFKLGQNAAEATKNIFVQKMQTYSNQMAQSDAGALGNVEHPFMAIASGPLWPGVVAPDRAQSID